jgi:hypothetical protein
LRENRRHAPPKKTTRTSIPERLEQDSIVSNH